jgi:UDP-glucose 4-epimerase
MEIKKYVLITGIAGLIGSRMAQYILDNTDYGVIGIDDLSGGYKENIPLDVEFFEWNLFNKDIGENIDYLFVQYDIEYVYHLAAYAAEGLSPFIRTFNYNSNIISTSNIINACIKYNVKRLIFTSSMAVYGHGKGDIFHEDQVPCPIDPYGIAKYACEMDIKVAGEQHGLDYCIIRPHNVYGINQNIWDKYRNVLGIWMFQKLNDQPLSIFGEGEQRRAFSYIDDILEPLWHSAILEEASKQIINLGGIKEYTIKEACAFSQEVFGTTPVVNYEQRHEVKYAIPTFGKSVNILGFKHKTNLFEGLSIMWDWAQKQPMRKRFEWDKFELDKGLYSFWSNK